MKLSYQTIESENGPITKVLVNTPPSIELLDPIDYQIALQEAVRLDRPELFDGDRALFVYDLPDRLENKIRNGAVGSHHILPNRRHILKSLAGISLGIFFVSRSNSVANAQSYCRIVCSGQYHCYCIDYPGGYQEVSGTTCGSTYRRWVTQISYSRRTPGESCTQCGSTGWWECL